MKVRNTEMTKYKNYMLPTKNKKITQNIQFLLFLFSSSKSREQRKTVKTEPYVSLMQFFNIHFWFHCLFR